MLTPQNRNLDQRVVRGQYNLYFQTYIKLPHSLYYDYVVLLCSHGGLELTDQDHGHLVWQESAAWAAGPTLLSTEQAGVQRLKEVFLSQLCPYQA